MFLCALMVTVIFKINIDIFLLTYFEIINSHTRCNYLFMCKLFFRFLLAVLDRNISFNG